MALFEVTPYDRRIYEEELKDFLPQKILDVHTHVWLDKYLDHKPLAPGEVKRTVTWPSLVALDNSIEDLQETYRLMLPGKDVTALMFTSRGAWDKNNAYVAECSRRTGFPRALLQPSGAVSGGAGAGDPQGRVPGAQVLSEPVPQVPAGGGDPHL